MIINDYNFVLLPFLDFISHGIPEDSHCNQQVAPEYLCLLQDDTSGARARDLVIKLVHTNVLRNRG